MNKKTMLIVGVVVAVLALGGLGYYMTQNKDEDSTANTTSNQESSESEPQEEDNNQQQGNLFTVSNGGKAQQCEMNYSGANGTGNGKMFTDGKGRGLMTLSLTTEKGNSSLSNTLVTSDKVYSWTTTDGSTFGFVFNKSTFTNSQNQNSSSSTNANPNQNFNINCSSWSVDESKLNVPSNVNFSSLPGQG